MGSNPGWKQYQRRVCRVFGGECVARGEAGSDCTGTPYAIEVKKTLNIFPRGSDFSQAALQGLNEKKPWILVTKRNRQPFGDAIVSMEMSTFLKLTGLDA